MKLTAREIELIEGMIESQRNHAERCSRILKSSFSSKSPVWELSDLGNRTMAEKQKPLDMERIALLEKIKAAAQITNAST